MRSITRQVLTAGVVMSACVLSTSAGAQGKSHKGEVKSQKVIQTKNGHVVKKTVYPKKTVYTSYRTGRVLCADGAWVATRDGCYNRGGLAVRQPNYGTTPRASARARERAAANSAVQRGAYADGISTNAIARCADGTYWHSTTRTGACYRHGGVASWF